MAEIPKDPDRTLPKAGFFRPEDMQAQAQSCVGV
jgi:hypothetical protein